MQLNCIIVDDDEGCRLLLEQIISQVDGLNLSGSYGNGLDAIPMLKSPDTHLVFLDVEMPEMNGFDILNGMEIKPLVILTTSHEKYALDSYKFDVVDYLLKPVTLPRFLNAITKAERHFKKLVTKNRPIRRDYLFIRKSSVINKVSIANILWIEAMGDYVVVQTKGEKYIIHSTMRSIESKLPEDKFIRVHRSYIVHIENIKSVIDTTIYVDEKPIPLGALYKDSFFKRVGYLG